MGGGGADPAPGGAVPCAVMDGFTPTKPRDSHLRAHATTLPEPAPRSQARTEEVGAEKRAGKTIAPMGEELDKVLEQDMAAVANLSTDIDLKTGAADPA